MKILLNVIVYFICSHGFLFSWEEKFDLQFTRKPKLEFDDGSVIYDPLIAGAHNFALKRYFKFEFFLNERRQWACFTREEKEMTDAIIGIKSLKDGDKIHKENLIEIKRDKSELHFIIYQPWGDKFTPYSFSCSLEDVINFSKNVEQIEGWLAANFDKKK